MVGFVVVPQQVPRAVIDAENPEKVTLAPNVAVVVVIDVAVGVVTKGRSEYDASGEYPVPAAFVA